MDGFAEDRRGDQEAAAALWNRALTETDSIQLKVEISQFLSLLGVRSSYLPELAELTPT